MLRWTLAGAIALAGIGAAQARSDSDQLVKKWGQCSRGFADRSAVSSTSAPREVAIGALRACAKDEQKVYADLVSNGTPQEVAASQLQAVRRRAVVVLAERVAKKRESVSVQATEPTTSSEIPGATNRVDAANQAAQ